MSLGVKIEQLLVVVFLIIILFIMVAILVSPQFAQVLAILSIFIVIAGLVAALSKRSSSSTEN
ncbi:MAG: hypothetical protein ABSF65_01380 [Candidatus Bathyarchaeia archaeon]